MTEQNRRTAAVPNPNANSNLDGRREGLTLGWSVVLLLLPPALAATTGGEVGMDVGWEEGVLVDAVGDGVAKVG